MRHFSPAIVTLLLISLSAITGEAPGAGKAPAPISALNSSQRSSFQAGWLGDAKAKEKARKDVAAWPALSKKGAEDVRKIVRSQIHLPQQPAGWKGAPSKAGGMREIDVPGLGKREYYLALPATYAPNHNWPLTISLHGAGGEGKGEYNWNWAKWHKQYQGLIACPSGNPPGAQWFNEQIPFVLAVLADVRKNFPVDDDKVAIHGFSNGGNGAWFYGLNYTSLWCGMITRGGGAPGMDQAVNFLNLPAFIVHGKNDSVIEPKWDEEAAAKLKDLKYNVTFKELPGDHKPYTDETNPEIMPWLDKLKRNPFPPKVVFKAGSNSAPRAYWIEWPATDTSADVTAEVKAGGNIEIKSSGASELTLWLADELTDLDKPVTVTCNGKKILDGPVTRTGADLLDWLEATGDRAAAPVVKLKVKPE